MKKKMVTYCCCAMMLFAGVSVFAEIDPPPPQNQPSPPGTPIDGGLSLLLIAGAAYGVYIKIKRLKE